MKTALIAAVFVGVCAVTVRAAEVNPVSPSGMSLQQKKSEILLHIDQRIALSQEEKVCVQAAQSHGEFRACRDKYRPVKQHDGQRNGSPQ